MKADTLFRAFTKLPHQERWKFWAKVRLWEVEQHNRLYDIAKQVSHQSGFPWTDPRTGITHQPPKRKAR
jgi:hypothetical protein